MNEPADIVERLRKWERSRIIPPFGELTKAADMIERLSSAPAKDECASPREAPSDEVSESAVERADHQLHQVLLRMALRVEGGRENVAIGQHFAKEIVAACSVARAIISALQKATVGEPRGEANPSPVADTEAMEAARRIIEYWKARGLTDPKQSPNARNLDELVIARALLAGELEARIRTLEAALRQCADKT